MAYIGLDLEFTGSDVSDMVFRSSPGFVNLIEKAADLVSYVHAYV